jgi:hypothetical protein
MLNQYSKLAEFQFSIRAENGLDTFLQTRGESFGSTTAYELSQYDKDDLIRSRGIGAKTFNEIDAILKRVGLDINDSYKPDKIIEKIDPYDAYVNKIKELLRTPIK